MKKRMIALFLLLCLLAACVPTPEVDAVKQKDTNQLIETVVAADREKDSAPGEPIPERFVCDFTVESSGFHVYGDVPIRVLSEDGTFPVLRVEQSALSNEQRLSLAKRLCRCDALYLWVHHYSREFLEERIAALIDEPTEEDKIQWFKDDPVSTEEEWQEYLAERKYYLELFQEQYRALPPDDEYPAFQQWDGSLPDPPAETGGDVYHSYYILVPTAEPDREQDRYDRMNVSDDPYGAIDFEAGKDTDDPTVQYNPYSFTESQPGAYRIPETEYDTPQQDAQISPREAADVALAAVDGFGTFAVEHILWSNCTEIDGDYARKRGLSAYRVNLTPVCHGAQLHYCSSASEDWSGMYMKGWPYENVSVIVGGDGRLLGFLWNGPKHKVTNVVSESAPLLPYSEILQRFEQQARIALAVKDPYSSTEFEITCAQLGLFRIREKDNRESGLLVPVWYFLGRFIGGQRGDYGVDHPFMIINAIDGSIIDPQKGY